MLVLGILAVVFAAAVSPLYSVVGTYEMEDANTSIVQALRQSQGEAIAGVGGLPHGVHRSGNAFTEFTGGSFATRVMAFDRTFMIPSNITLSGATDILFNLSTGFADALASITLSRALSNSRTVMVNAVGSVDW